MARSHARIGTSIWTEPTFRALPRDPQRAYFLATSQADLSRCGVIPFRVRRLAKFADDDSPTKLRAAFRRLEKTRHVIIDEDAEELLVRTYVRHDGLLAQPQVVAAMVGDVALIDSPKIRLAFLAELHRIWHLDDLPEAERKGLRLAMGEHDTDRYLEKLGPALAPGLRAAWEAGSFAPCTPGSNPPCSAPFAQALAGARAPSPAPAPAPSPAPSASTLPATVNGAHAHHDTPTRPRNTPGTALARTVDHTDGPVPSDVGSGLAQAAATNDLLDAAGPWVPSIRAKVATQVDQLLTAGVPTRAVADALTVWKTRKAGPKLLPHLVNDQLTPAEQADPRFAGLLADARNSA